MKGKYQNKIFYVIMSIIVCSVIILTLNYSVFMTKQYLTQYDQNVLDKVDDKGDRISNNLSYMNKTLMNIKMSEEVNKWSKATKWQDMHLQAIDVQKKLRKETIYDNDLKYTLAITFLDDRELVVSGDMTSQKYMFFENKGMTKEQVDGLYKKLKDNKSKVLCEKSVDIAGERYIHYFTKFSYNQVELLYIASISETNLLEFMKDDEGSYYIFNKDNIIAENPQEIEDIVSIHEKAVEDYKEDYPIDLDKISKLYTYKGKKVVYKPLHELGWTLGYVYETNLIESTGLIIGILCIAGVASMVGLLVAKLTTARLYKPVKNLLQEIGSKSDLEEKEPQNEFEYIYNHNKNIEEKNDALVQVIQKNKDIIKEKYYKELLNGIRAHKKDEYKEYAIQNKTQRVVLLEFENLGQRLEDEQTSTIKQNIKKELVSFKHIQYVNIDYKTCCFIMQEEMDINLIKKTILQIISKIEDYINLNMKICIGPEAVSMDELHESFLQAQKAMEFKNSFPNKLILTKEDIDKLDFTVATFPVRVENKLISNTIHGEEEALTLLQELLEENLVNDTRADHYKKNFVLAILVTLNRIFDQMAVLPQAYLKSCYQDYEALYRPYTPATQVHIQKVFECIIEQVRKQDVQSKQDIAQDMIDYIHTNYLDDIMLEDMAATLNISVKYCSVLFKRVTGTNFKTMLNQYRVEKAKELLEDVTIKISEVALQVGFNSPNTFIRVFNKYEGMSPGTYQEQNLKKVSPELTI